MGQEDNASSGPRPNWWDKFKYNFKTDNDEQTNAFIKGSDGVLTTLDVHDAAAGGRRTEIESREYPPNGTINPVNHPTSVFTSEGDVVAMLGKPSGLINIEKGDGDHVNLVLHRSLKDLAGVKVSYVGDIPQLGDDGLTIKLDLIGKDGKEVVGSVLVHDETVRPSSAEPVIHQVRIADDDGTILATSELGLNNKNVTLKENQNRIIPIKALQKVREMEQAGFIKPTENSKGLDVASLDKITPKGYETWFESGPGDKEKEFDRQQAEKRKLAENKPAHAAKPVAPIPHHARHQVHAAKSSGAFNCTNCEVHIQQGDNKIVVQPKYVPNVKPQTEELEHY